MTTTAAATAAFFSTRKPMFLNIIIHLLHSHIHCDLDHSCSKLTQHDLHFFTARREIFIPKREIVTLSTVGNTDQFRISRRRGGSHVTREVEGGTFILEEILTSPGPKLLIY